MKNKEAGRISQFKLAAQFRTIRLNFKTKSPGQIRKKDFVKRPINFVLSWNHFFTSILIVLIWNQFHCFLPIFLVRNISIWHALQFMDICPPPIGDYEKLWVCSPPKTQMLVAPLDQGKILPIRVPWKTVISKRTRDVLLWRPARSLSSCSRFNSITRKLCAAVVNEVYYILKHFKNPESHYLLEYNATAFTLSRAQRRTLTA